MIVSVSSMGRAVNGDSKRYRIPVTYGLLVARRSGVEDSWSITQHVNSLIIRESKNMCTVEEHGDYCWYIPDTVIDLDFQLRQLLESIVFN